MGSAQSYLPSSTQAAFVTGAVLGVVAIGVVAKLNAPSSSPTSVSQDAPSTSLSKGKSKLKKEKLKQKELTKALATSQGVEIDNEFAYTPLPSQFKEVIPGQFSDPVLGDEVKAAPASRPKKKKEKKKASKAKEKALNESSTTPTTVDSPVTSDNTKTKSKRQQKREDVQSSLLQQSLTSIDTDSSWTRVESSKRAGKEFGGMTSTTEEDSTTTTDDNDPIDPQIIANRSEIPDMLDTSEYPVSSRVLKVQPRVDERPAKGFTWGDYEDVDLKTGRSDAGEDDPDGGGWGVVKSRGRAKKDHNSSSGLTATASNRAPETLTKKQRQNAAKRASEKELKAAAEAERQAALRTHKKVLEQEKQKSQSQNMIGDKISGTGNAKGGVSGGMRATVDEKGRLVWE